MANMLLVQAAVKVGTSKTGRKIIGAICIFFMIMVFLIICLFSSLISVFTGSGRITSNFNAQETAIYEEIRIIYNSYAISVRDEMAKMEETYRKMNMYPYLVEVYDPETEEMVEVQRWACRIDTKREFKDISTAYVLAYLSVKHHSSFLSNKNNIRINANEVRMFFDTINEISLSISQPAGGKELYRIYNTLMTPEEIADKFFVHDFQKEQFLESLVLISQFLGTENFISGNIYALENQLGIPLYYQYASPWGSSPYGGGNIAKNGCAPTCIAMVFTYLKGYSITPTDIVAFTKNNYYVTGVGSSWTIFEACANKWNVKCTQISLSQNSILKALDSGKPVILSMGPGTFTRSGHFIVLTGITENGNVTVNDPNDNDTKKHALKEFNISQILREAKGGWVFE